MGHLIPNPLIFGNILLSESPHHFIDSFYKYVFIEKSYLNICKCCHNQDI